MSIRIKTNEELDIIREAGKRLARVVRMTCEQVRPGITTRELDQYAETLILEGGDIPAFKNYRPAGASSPFPATACISLNEEIVHGIPDERILVEGDIVTIDIGLKHQGLFVDHAITVPVGKIDEKTRKLLNTTQEALRVALDQIRPGAHTGDVGHAIEEFIDGRYGIVKDLGGHGVGHHIHEDPIIPNYGRAGKGPEFVSGMVVAIEPMITMGSDQFIVEDDDWTLSTADGSLSAHFEHTIIVTPDGAEIVTKE